MEILQIIILHLLLENYIQFYSTYLSIFYTIRPTKHIPEHQKKNKNSDRVFFKILVEINLEALCSNKILTEVRKS